MAKYAVLLHGKNLVLLHEGKRRSGGVYSWRCVEADSEESAVPKAIEKLTHDRFYMEEVWNAAENPPEMFAEQVDSLDPSIDLAEADTACVFYIDEDSESENHASSEATKSRPR